jgi:hypothetical protein
MLVYHGGSEVIEVIVFPQAVKLSAAERSDMLFDRGRIGNAAIQGKLRGLIWEIRTLL